MMTTSMLHVDGITKSFGRMRALSEVSFSVRKGEILGLIGPNGAGKTTLFECLAGVLPADHGDGPPTAFPVAIESSWR